VRRVVAGGPLSTNRALHNIWYLKRFDSFQNGDITAGQSQIWRSYVTATKAAPKAKTKAKTSKTKTAKPKKKTAVKKAVKKPAKKKKKVAAKPKPKPRVKKPLTDEQKLKLAKKKERLALKALKEAALSPPTPKPNSAWAVLLLDLFKEKTPGVPIQKGFIQNASAKYKSLTPQ